LVTLLGQEQFSEKSKETLQVLDYEIVYDTKGENYEFI